MSRRALPLSRERFTITEATANHGVSIRTVLPATAPQGRGFGIKHPRSNSTGFPTLRSRLSTQPT